MDDIWAEHMIHTYQPVVYRYICSHVYSKQDAEELTQDVFMNCFKHRHQFDPERCSEQAWLFIIAKNRLRWYYRDHKIQSSLNDMVENGYEPEDDAAVDALNLMECRETVARLLLSLDERSRIIMILRYFGEFSNREIAHKLGISEGNVRVLQTRALARMREKLTKMA